MASSLSKVLLFSALAAAQTTTIDILLPVEGIHEVTGTAVAVGPEVTTLAVHCGDDVNNVQCHILGTQTMIYGPSTLSIIYSHAGDDTASYFSEDLNCAIQTKTAICQLTLESKNSAGSTVTQSYTQTDTNIETRLIPATITEGAEKLMNAAKETSSVKETSSAEETSSASSESGQTDSSSAVETAQVSTAAETAETPGSSTVSPPSETPTVPDSGVQKASAQAVGAGLVAFAAALLMS